MTLSEKDRDDLFDACPAAIASYAGDHDDLFTTVEAIVARHVTAALNEAADRLGHIYQADSAGVTAAIRFLRESAADTT